MLYSRQSKRPVLRRPLEPKLRPVVAVVNEPTAADRMPIVQSLFESIEDEASFGRTGNPPANDATSESIGDEGDIDEALPGGDVGKIREPECVRPQRLELAFYPVERRRSRRSAPTLA